MGVLIGNLTYNLRPCCVDLELSGRANGAIVGAGRESQLFAMLGVMLSPNPTWLMSIVVVLLLTYVVTSADSAVLIINTMNAAGDEGWTAFAASGACRPPVTGIRVRSAISHLKGAA